MQETHGKGANLWLCASCKSQDRRILGLSKTAITTFPKLVS